MYSYQGLDVWKKSFELTKGVYHLTDLLPSEERFGLTSQMRRAAVSIPSNIAEGYRRRHKNDRRHFMEIAYGSASELETQLQLSAELFELPNESKKHVHSLLTDVLMMLNRLCASLSV